MANIPENENLNQTPTETEEAFADDEFSTVFSNPTEHRKTADKVKNKKRLPIFIAALLVVAILVGGTVAVIKLIPEKEEETSSAPVIEDIKVLDKKSDDFKTVTVKNSNGSFKFYSVTEVEKTESSSSSTTSSEPKETVTWYLEGYDKEKVDTTNISAVISAAASVSASREVTQRTAADCGLDKPVVTVEVEPKEGEKFTLYIGKESPDGSGYYFKTSDSEKIYVVGSDVYGSFVFEAISFANADALPGITVTDDMDDHVDDNDALISFDKMTISGKNFPETVVIEMNSDEKLAEYATYMITSPSKRIADNVDGVFGLFTSGLTASGAYSFDVSDKALAAVGLNNPDIVVKIDVNKSSMTYKFKLQPDGAYAVICDGAKLIKKVDASNITFADYDVSDFYSSWVALISIDDLKGLTFKTADKTYDFGIKANEDEEAEDGYIINYGDKDIDCSSFQSFYQECISLSCTDFETTKLSGKPDYAMIFNYKDGSKLTVNFTKASETRYQYSIDGVDTGKVNSAAIKKLVKSLEELVK